MKQAGSTRLCVLVFKMILVLKELRYFSFDIFLTKFSNILVFNHLI